MDRRAAVRHEVERGKLSGRWCASGQSADEQSRRKLTVPGYRLRPHRRHYSNTIAYQRALDRLVIQMADLAGVLRRGILMMMQHAAQCRCYQQQRQDG